jgi:hypothetical protein
MPNVIFLTKRNSWTWRNFAEKIHFNSKNTNLQVFLQKDRGYAMLATGEN